MVFEVSGNLARRFPPLPPAPELELPLPLPLVEVPVEAFALVPLVEEAPPWPALDVLPPAPAVLGLLPQPVAEASAPEETTRSTGSARGKKEFVSIGPPPCRRGAAGGPW